MSKKRNNVIKLSVDVQTALDKFPFIKNEKITFLEREEKSCLYSVCDAQIGCDNFCCYWDRHPIKGSIVKCPIRKVYRGKQQSYTSAINGNTYDIRDDINTETYYYETDGNFCSDECLWAFLNEEELRNPLYANSKQIILSIRGNAPKPAPHWRLLKAYGGTMTIEKFREAFKHKEYTLEEITSGFFPFCYKFKESYHIQ